MGRNLHMAVTDIPNQPTVLWFLASDALLIAISSKRGQAAHSLEPE